MLCPQLWGALDDTATPSFLLIAFADLKKYKYYYWFAFPAFVAKPPWEIVEDEGWSTLPTDDAQGLYDSILGSASPPSTSSWLAKRSDDGAWITESSLTISDNFFGGLEASEASPKESGLQRQLIRGSYVYSAFSW